MFDPIRDVSLGANSNDEEIEEACIQLFQQQWLMGYDYRKSKPFTYVSKPLPESVQHHPVFQIMLYYVLFLSESLRVYDFKGIEEWVTKEVAHWDKEGGLCIYFSVLLITLLTEEKVLSKDEIQLVQGYYDFALREDFPQFIPIPKRQLGLHAWIAIDKAVIDLSISQNEHHFKFEGEPLILNGEIPNGMNLKGYTEIKRTVNRYIRQFAKQAGMKPEQWIQSHRQNAYITMEKFLKE